MNGLIRYACSVQHVIENKFNVHLQDKVSKGHSQHVGATTSAMKELLNFSGLITCSNIVVT